MKQNQRFDDSIRETYESDIFVQKRFKPADDETQAFLIEMLNEMGFPIDTRLWKWVYALSDVMKAAECDTGRCVVWPAGNSNRTKPYSTKIVQRLQKALLKHDKMSVHLEPTRGRSTTYKIIEVPSFLRFKEHCLNSIIQLRDAKPEGYFGQKSKSRGRAIYDPEMTEAELAEKSILEDRIWIIANFMKDHPLKSHRSTWNHTYRIFNDRSFKKGGRFQGGWVNRKKAERFTYTIDDQPIIQVDLKAAFFYFAHTLLNIQTPLPADPYKPLQTYKGMTIDRNAIKALFSKFMSLGSCKNFPPTHKKDAKKNPINFRDLYSLPEGYRARDFEGHMLQTYPWLRLVEQRAGDMMFLESSIVEETLLRLVDLGIPAYPLADCVIGKLGDEAVIAKTLQEVCFNKIGTIPFLEVEYNLHTATLIAPPSYNKSSSFNIDTAKLTDNDDDLIDDEDISLNNHNPLRCEASVSSTL